MDQMDHRQIVEAKLLEVGIRLSNEDLEELTAAYATLLEWEAVVQAMVRPETEPALIFKAKVEG
jgi:hypothetical protein